MTFNPTAHQEELNTAMTLDQARQVMYLKHYYRPMGELFDSAKFAVAHQYHIYTACYA